MNELIVGVFVGSLLLLMLFTVIVLLYLSIGDLIQVTTRGKLEDFLMSLRNIVFGVLFGLPLTLILIGLIFGV